MRIWLVWKDIMRLDYWLPQGVYDIKAFDLFTNLLILLIISKYIWNPFDVLTALISDTF